MFYHVLRFSPNFVCRLESVCNGKSRPFSGISGVTTWDQLGFPHSNTGRFPKGIDKPRHTRPHWSKASSSLAEIMETCTGWPLVDHWLIDVNWCWLYFMWMDYILTYLHDLSECWWMDMNGLKLIQQRSSYQDALVLEQIHVNAPSTLIRGLWV